MPKDWTGGRLPLREDREAIKKCLLLAFPLGEGGSFASLRTAIKAEDKKRRD